MRTFSFASPASTGGSGALLPAARLAAETASAQPARPLTNAAAGNEAAGPTLLPIGAWVNLARASHYGATGLRPNLGLSAEQSDSSGFTLFGWPARERLDSFRVSDAALLVQKGCSRSEIEVSLPVRGRSWSSGWSDDSVDFKAAHAGSVTRIHRQGCDASRQELWPARASLGCGSGPCPAWVLLAWPHGILGMPLTSVFVAKMFLVVARLGSPGRRSEAVLGRTVPRLETGGKR